MGPEPTPRFPGADSIGIGTVRITAPSPQVTRSWLTCEWATTDRVQWLYTGGGTIGYPGGPITLFGETVQLDVFSLLDGDGNPQSLGLSRTGAVAPYRIDPGSAPGLSHAPDWTSGSVTFDRLRMDPEAWPPGPLPTPAGSFGRPLGGDGTATNLSGSFDWSCGPRPDGLPTPVPHQSAETHEPTAEPLALPNATLSASGGLRLGIPGCGFEFGVGGQITGGTSCGDVTIPVPPFALEIPSSINISEGQDLTFTLPAGFHFESWTYAFVDYGAATLYRGAEPPGIVTAGRDESTTSTTVTVAGPSTGDWIVRLTFSATNGDIVVHGMPDHFHVVAP